MSRAKVAALAHTTLGDVDYFYRTGRVSQVEYEAYMRAWAMAGGYERGYRHATGWTTPSDDPAVEELAAELVEISQNPRRKPEE